jgi:hypothetical protein
MTSSVCAIWSEIWGPYVGKYKYYELGDMTSWSLVCRYQHFRDFFRVEEWEGRRAAHSSKMLIPLYQFTLCHIQEDCNFSLKSSSSFQFLILHSYSFNHNAWKVIYIIQHTASHLLHFNMIVLLLFRTQIFNVLYDPRTFRGHWFVVLMLDSTCFHCC